MLLLLVYCGASPVLGVETPRLSRRPPPPQTPAPGPAVGAVRESAPTGPVSGVTLQENRLSVDLREQDVRAVIETVAAQGNIEVRHPEGLPNTRISVRFTDLPVLDGLKRILRTADVTGYVLITDTAGPEVQVRRMLFLPVAESSSSTRPSAALRRPPMSQPSPAPAPEPNPAQSVPPPQAESERREETSGGSVFEDIKNNTAARRLLSQLVHPNEQVRERALERLVQLVGDDQKQAELLETLEPLMENLASEEKTTRDDARVEIRRLLNR
ncbi:MAG TPA: hypothetical protein VIH59_33565 [Candidatus Tectomicrobia bacterium]